MANIDKAYFNNDIQTNSSVNQLDEEQNYSSKKEGDGGTTGRYCKTIFKFLFSHIGLVVMVIAYACAGSFLFQLLEQHNEAIACEEGKGQESTKIVNLKSNLLSYIQFNISSNNDPSKDNETVANAKIETWLTEFRDTVLDIKSSYAYDGSDCGTTRWTFMNTLLFTVTIITTIGYGHIAPKTWEGQIVCICYATIGIPLFLMCLANISSVLGDMFRFLYSRVCCRLCLNRKKKNPKTEKKENSTLNETENDHDKIKNSEDDFDGKVDRVGLETGTEWTKNNKKEISNAKQSEAENSAKVVDDNEDLENDMKGEDENEKVSVPLTITMIILTGYIIIGAIIFFEFENWEIISAAYFCFITLATIGFGDFVPGQNPDTSSNTATLQLVVTFIYILLGMSILAMCFDLMQEEIIAKFTWIGKKLGIVEKEDEDIAMENNALNEKNEKLNEKEFAEENNNIKSNSSQFSKKNEPIFVSEKSNFNRNSPAPSYSATTDKKNYRSNLSNNINQRQPSYIDN